MSNKRNWIDISNMDALICIAIAAIWFFLLWLSADFLSLKA